MDTVSGGVWEGTFRGCKAELSSDQRVKGNDHLDLDIDIHTSNTNITDTLACMMPHLGMQHGMHT